MANKKQKQNNNIKQKRENKNKKTKNNVFNWTLFSCLVLFLHLDSEIDPAKELVSVVLILQVRRAINFAL